MQVTDEAAASVVEIRRFAEALRAVDLGAPPSGPLARELHMAVGTLAEADVGALGVAALTRQLAGLYGALSEIDKASLARLTAHELVELIVGVDDAKALLEMPDLSRVPSGELAAWFRELYYGIMRLRVVSSRLHRAWAATAASRPVREVR